MKVSQLETRPKKSLIVKIKNRNCSLYLGYYVAERILSHVFKDANRMPYGNKGFDFMCNKGMKIDVKSSCLHNNHYTFLINHNKIADYFLCIGFDNRENLNPQYIWLMKSSDFYFHKCYKKLEYRQFRDTSNVNIYLSKLDSFSKYELPDKLQETIECCSILKMNNKNKGES